MVYIPKDPVRLGHEYYRAHQKVKKDVAAVEEFGSLTAVKQQSAAGNLRHEMAASLHPAVTTKITKRKKRKDKVTREDMRDIVTARLRGGLVQYMLKMGYSLNEATREADRAIAQMSRFNQDDVSAYDAASRAVYLNRPPMMVDQSQKIDSSVMAAFEIAATPKTLVDFDI